MRVVVLSFPCHLWQQIREQVTYLLPKPNKDQPLMQHLLSLHLLLTVVFFLKILKNFLPIIYFPLTTAPILKVKILFLCVNTAF